MSYLGEMYAWDTTDNYMDEYLRGVPQNNYNPASQNVPAAVRSQPEQVYPRHDPTQLPQVYTGSTSWPVPEFIPTGAAKNFISACSPSTVCSSLAASESLTKHKTNEPFEARGDYSVSWPGEGASANMIGLLFLMAFVLVIITSICLRYCVRAAKEIKKIRKAIRGKTYE